MTMNDITAPLTQWVLAEPGRLVLPQTKYEIRWIGTKYPWAFWDGNEINPGGSIEEAKRIAENHMRDIIEMGLEP
jgi:hypothetical protein